MSPQVKILARRLERDANDALLDAINTKLGGDEWEFHEVSDRLLFVSFAGVECIYFDQELILRIHPATLSICADGRTLTASRGIERFLPKLREAVH